MTDHEAQDSNIIDFIEIKMLKMYEDFSAQGETDNAAAIWDALSAYVSGSATIVFRRGIPFISPLQGDDITEES